MLDTDQRSANLKVNKSLGVKNLKINSLNINLKDEKDILISEIKNKFESNRKTMTMIFN